MKGTSALPAYNSRCERGSTVTQITSHSRHTITLGSHAALVFPRALPLSRVSFINSPFLEVKCGKSGGAGINASDNRSLQVIFAFSIYCPFQPVMLSTRVGPKQGRSSHRVLDSVKGPPGFIVGLPRVPYTGAAFAEPTLMTPFIGGSHPPQTHIQEIIEKTQRN